MPDGFDLDMLAKLSDGFSGAEIEQAIVSGLYDAFSVGAELDTQTLVTSLAETVPLSKTMSEELNRRAREIAADLVVMGAYGHSRFRQAILGGATRNMLEKAKVPVFMAR